MLTKQTWRVVGKRESLSNNIFQPNLERSQLQRRPIAAKMSDWEEEDEVSTSTSQNAYIPPGGGGWFDKTGDENFSDSPRRRPGFGRGRGNRFGGNDNSSPANRNTFHKDGNSRGFGRTEGGFGRENRDSKFTRGENSRSWRGGETEESNDAGNWRDRRSRDNSSGFGRARGGQGRERNSTEMMVPSDDVRYIIG